MLTAYGIETGFRSKHSCFPNEKLQQCLPFTVLKLTSNTTSTCTTISSCNSAYRLRYWNAILKWNTLSISVGLQQCLSFTVLKLTAKPVVVMPYYTLQQCLPFTVLKHTFWYYDIEATQFSCNSTYRLRYAQKGARQQRSKAAMRAAHLKYLNEVKVKQR